MDKSENVREQLDDVGYFARRRCRHARKKVSRLYGDAPDYMSDNPSWSLLISFLARLVVCHRDAVTG